VFYRGAAQGGAVVRNVLRGPVNVLVGIGVTLAAPIVFPAVAKVARPIAKKAIKKYLGLVESAKAATTKARDEWNHLVAEAKAERNRPSSADIPV
jgi:hypothetical protein